MTERARMFLTGPKVVRAGARRGASRRRTLGGPDVHERNGVCQLVAADERDGARRARELLVDPPGRRRRAARRGRSGPTEPVGDPSAPVPAEARRVYDVREVIEALVDRGESLELSPGWARNMVTALARIDGRPVGVIANQPRRLGGVIDAAAAEKAAPVRQRPATASDCRSSSSSTRPGSCPAAARRRPGVIRHGASLLRAFAAASVPRLTVVLRKAYGGAVITMNSKDLGADMVFAWPRRRDRDHGRGPGGRHRPSPRSWPTSDGSDLRERAHRRLRRRASDRRRRRRQRLRRRGDRAAETRDAPRLGAGGDGGAMSAADPYAVIAQVMRAHSSPSASRRRSVPTRLSATASPPAPAAAPASAGPTGWPPASRTGAPAFTYRNLAVEGASQRRGARPARPGAAAGARPGHGRLRGQRRAVLGPARSPTPTRRNLAAIFRRLRSALPGGDGSRPRPRPSAGRSWSWARGPGRGSSAGSPRFNAAPGRSRQTHGARPASRSPITRGSASPPNFVADGLHPSAHGHAAGRRRVRPAARGHPTGRRTHERLARTRLRPARDRARA